VPTFRSNRKGYQKEGENRQAGMEEKTD